MSTAIRQMTTHRIPRGYADNVLCFIRDDNGPLDLTGKTLTATIRSYKGGSRGWNDYGYRGGMLSKRTTSPATQVAPGQVTFPVTTSQQYQRLNDDLFQFDIDADGQHVYRALLEIV